MLDGTLWWSRTSSRRSSNKINYSYRFKHVHCMHQRAIWFIRAKDQSLLITFYIIPLKRKVQIVNISSRRGERGEGRGERGEEHQKTCEELTILFKSESSCCFLSGCLVFCNSFCNCCNKVQNNTRDIWECVTPGKYQFVSQQILRIT